MTGHPDLSALRRFAAGQLGATRLAAVRRHIDQCALCQSELSFPETEEEALLRNPPPALARALAAVRAQPMPPPSISARLASLGSGLGRSVISMLESLGKSLADPVDAALQAALAPAAAQPRRGSPAADDVRGAGGPIDRNALFLALSRALREYPLEEARLVAAALALEAGDAAAADAAVELLPKRGPEAARLRAWHAAVEGDERRLTRQLDALARAVPAEAKRIRLGLAKADPSAKVFLATSVERYVTECSKRIPASP